MDINSLRFFCGRIITLIMTSSGSFNINYLANFKNNFSMNNAIIREFSKINEYQKYSDVQAQK